MLLNSLFPAPRSPLILRMGEFAIITFSALDTTLQPPIHLSFPDFVSPLGRDPASHRLRSYLDLEAEGGAGGQQEIDLGVTLPVLLANQMIQ